MIVKYRRLYNIGPYLNEEIGFETNSPDGLSHDAYIMQVEALKELADKAHKKINPELAPSLHDYNTGQPEIVQVEKETAIGDLETQIRSVTDKKVLDSYKLLVKGKPELEKLYLAKLEELS